MAKMTIYVPDDLKRRMDDTEGVNWSPLACLAFESKLAELIKKKGAKDMNDVVSRLRASKLKTQGDRTSQGFEDGRRWAKESAEAVQLERLDALRNDYRLDCRMEADFFETGDSDAWGAWESLYFRIEPGDDVDREAAANFWESVRGGAPEEVTRDPAYLKAFVEGAVDVWFDVKNEI